MYAVTEFVLTTKNKYGGLLDFVINNSRSFDMIQTQLTQTERWAAGLPSVAKRLLCH